MRNAKFEGLDLMEKLLSWDPRKRPSAVEVDSVPVLVPVSVLIVCRLSGTNILLLDPI